MTGKRTGGRGLVAALAASAVLTSGCTGPVDVDELPGTYRSDETGGEIRIEADRTFSATGVSVAEAVGGVADDPVDFSGSWDFVDSDTSSDFVYLGIEDGGLGTIGGIQLYPSGRSEVEFRADPDGPPSLVLTRVEAS